MSFDDRATLRFTVFAALTVATIYTLILVGGVVRATGAGMGCPDWPTCFGQWIPPTDASQLPADYQRIYADRGYADTTFNVVKTWTEYLNRLLGAFTGLAILATFLAALPLRGRMPGVVPLSLAAVILVAVQGWLGSRVVASNLAPGMITLHMLLAQVILGLVIASLVIAVRPRIDAAAVRALPRALVLALYAAMALGLLQLVLGTQVREAVDHLARAAVPTERHLWIDNLPLVFALHKWLAAPLLALTAWLAWTILSTNRSGALRVLSVALLVQMLGTVAVGMSMDRLHLPMFSQPLHLLLGSLIFGTQLAILLVMRSAGWTPRATSQIRESRAATTHAPRVSPTP